PATAAGRQGAWFLARLHSRGDGASLADAERYAPTFVGWGRPAGSDEAARQGWRANAERLGEIRDLRFRSVSEFEFEAQVEADKDRRWTFTLAVEEAPPHRITRVQWDRLHDFTLEVREAEAADWPSLAQIERRAPIVRGDVKIWFDRGEAWFDFSRLMEDCTVGIAFVDGEPAAITCGARHGVRIGGADKSIVTVSHLRVLPEHQRKGLWGEVNRVLEKYWPHVDGSAAYIAVDNSAMQHGFRHTPDKWPAPLLWARLECAKLAGPPSGRIAASADAPQIAGILNAFHDGEEMFVPMSEARLGKRLARAPDLYSWNRVWLAQGAVAGVWPAGRALRLVTAREGEEKVSEPGVLLDYGFAPGSEREFEALLRAWCGWLAQQGMDRLSIFTSPASRGAGLITALASEVEAFNLWTPGIPVPPGAASRALYIDPIYF
ncbi:MAG: hypothetical protein ACYC8V_05470, partial [Caulobacteraceae bacterium]